MQPLSLPFVVDLEGCSRAGAEYALPRAAPQIARVYAAIEAHGPVSDRELCELTGLPLNIVNARRWALMKKDVIVAVDAVKGPRGVLNTRYAVSTDARCTDRSTASQSI